MSAFESGKRAGKDIPPDAIEGLTRRGISATRLEPRDFRVCSPEESRRLTDACPTFRVRLTGVERDGTPFDVVKTVRAPYQETAIGMLTVQAIMCYGCRVDSAAALETEGA